MKMNIFLKKHNDFVGLGLFITFCAAAVVFSQECAQGIKRGIELSLGQLIPSLFFIIIIADFAVKSGILNIRGKLFSKIAGILFGVSPCGMWAILLSLIGGYPVGARVIASMYEKKKIPSEEAVHLSYFCVCAGPGFLISFVGEHLLFNKNSGIILFTAQAISVLILGIGSKFVFHRRASLYDSNVKFENFELGTAIVSAVNSGAKVCMSVCATVVAFSGFLGLVSAAAGNGGLLISVLTAILEVTTACREFAPKVWLPIIGFITGFGGFCVHFQIFGILSGIRISKIVFLIYRSIQGVITGLLVMAAVYAFPNTVSVFSTIETPPVQSGSTTILGGMAIMFTSVLFIFTVWRKRLCAE